MFFNGIDEWIKAVREKKELEEKQKEKVKNGKHQHVLCHCDASSRLKEQTRRI